MVCLIVSNSEEMVLEINAINTSFRMKTKILLMVLFLSSFSWGQTTVTASGMTLASCPGTPTTTWTTPPTGLTFSNITRGSGVTCSTLTTGITGSGFNGTLANNITNNCWYTFTITSNATTSFTLNSLSLISQVSSATGTPNVSVQYSTDGGTTKNVIGAYTPTASSATYGITPGSTISVPASTTLTIYVIPNTLTASTTTCRITNGSSVSVTTSSTSTSYSGVTTGSGSEPGTISSLINTQAASSLNFDFLVTDDANIAGGNDVLPTLISQIVIPQGTGNDIADWTQIIAGAELNDGTNTLTGTVNATNITFSSIGTGAGALGNITDGSTKTYTLKVWLKTALGGTLPTTVDGLNLAFKIDRTNFTTPSSATSTQFETGAGTVVESGSTNNAVDVAATKLVFVQVPTTVNQNATMLPAVTISAVDANGNRDLGYSTNVSLTSTGTMTGAPLVVAASSGLATYGSIVHTASGTGFTMAATSGSLTATGNSSTFNVIAPSATIGVTGYAHNSTYAFGSYAAGVTPPTQTFTITNTGTASMTISSIVITNTTGTGFSISGAVPTTVAVGSSAAVTVQFSTSTVGACTGNLVINNNSANQTAYVINLTGTVTTNSASDIIRSSGFTEPSNIAYGNYQTASISGSGAGTSNIKIAEFTIQDGGGTSDNDSAATILNSITFSVTNSANIRRLALYENTTSSFVGTEQAGAASVTFSGLTLTASDNGSKTFSVYASFNAAVTDNQNIGVTITSATANVAGTTFAAANAGGAASIASGNSNKIVVTADRLTFVAQPTTTSVNVSMAPSVTVSANDILGNRDTDFVGSVSIVSTGTLTGSPVTSTAVSGLATFSSLTHTVIGTGFYLTATTTGLANNTNVNNANTFDITSIVYAHGDYRSTGSGTWLGTSTASWEKYSTVTGLWTASTEPASNTANAVYVSNGTTITTGSSFGGVNIKVLSGGTFNCTFNSTAASLYIYDGGTASFSANPFKITNDFEIEDNGTFIYNYSSNAGNSASVRGALWNGTEKFHPKSNFIIKDHKTGAGNYFLPVADTNISTQNYNGVAAYFGNLIIDLGSAGDNNTFRLTSSNTATDNSNFNGKILTYNDLIFRTSNSSTNVNLFYGATNLTINGNLKIEDTYTNTTITGTTSAITGTLTVNGDFINESAKTFTVVNNASGNITLAVNGNVKVNTTNANAGTINLATTGTSVVNLKGNLTVGSTGTLTSAVASNFNFAGTYVATPQTIDVASTGATENQNIAFKVNSGAYAQLINQDLELGNNSSVTVAGILDFGFNGSTPLLVKEVPAGATSTAFTLNTAGTAKITSPKGLIKTTNAAPNNGNVVTDTRTFTNASTFHYIGIVDQETGDGIAGSNAKTIVCELNANTTKLSLTSTSGITSPGLLDIRKGQVIESTTNYITASSGGLTMADGTLYQIPSLSTDATDLIPRLTGISSDYVLSGASTIELNATDDITLAYDQYLRGSRTYRNLTFSTSGTKTVSTNTTSITGTVLVKDATILDVADNAMGGTGTNLTMTDTAQYSTAGITTKPDARGTYTLGTATKISFTNSLATMERIYLTPVYANIDIVGSNVGTNGASDVITLQSGTTFAVKSTGVFKQYNSNGFNGSTATAVSSANSPTINLNTGSTVEYAGANQTLTAISSPNPYYNMTVSGTGTKSIATASEIFIDNQLNVTAATLQVDSNKLLTVRNAINNTSGNSIVVLNGGNLVQVTDVDNATANTNVGNIRMTRTSRAMKIFDYIYWGSPVKESVFSQIPAIFSASFDWNLSGAIDGTWNYLSTTSPGKGFITRFSSASAATDFNFTGTPNNGVVKTYGDSYDNGVTTTVTGNTILLGNPYPSAISASSFVTDPANLNKIGGTLYFWTSITPVTNYVYTTNDYATWNGTGSTAVSDVSGTTTLKPTGKIASGQGFFAVLKADYDVTFNNSMRLRTTTDNSQFFRNNHSNDIEAPTGKVWLNLYNANAFRQTLVGYVSGATDDYDNLYDGTSITYNPINIYSILNNEPLVIQGRQLPFVNTDLVPLGVKITNSGDYKIAIDHLEGLFEEGQNVYLEDKVLNIIHDLKQAPYEFYATSGTVNNRFVLRYTNEALATPDFETIKNSVVVAVSHGELTVKSSLETIKNITVYDLLGRQLFEADAIGQNEFVTNTITMSQQALLVKIRLANGMVVIRKTIL